MTDQERIENLEKENQSLRKLADSWKTACEHEIKINAAIQSEMLTVKTQRDSYKRVSEMYESLCSRYAEKYGPLVGTLNQETK